MAPKENVLTRTSDFLCWFLPKIEKFPRNYKFLFGDRIVKIELDLMERLIEAYYSKDKLRNLRLANIEIEKLRQLMSVCVQMKFLSAQQLEFATRELNQIGSLVGGWIRQQGCTNKTEAGSSPSARCRPTFPAPLTAPP